MIAPNEIVEQRWTLDRAFSAAPIPLGTALGALALGGLALFGAFRAVGRDQATKKDPKLVATFVPTAAGKSEFEVLAEVRPGHVGTLMDEHVDPVDVTATLLDLAVRGHIRIIELPDQNLHTPLDWTFERLQGNDELRPFEATLLEAIAPVGGAPVVVSEIAEPIENAIPEVQSQLYDEVVERGWFKKRPDSKRNTWRVIGWTILGLALAALVLLIMFTEFGLLGLSLVALAIGLLLLAGEMPRRTSDGVATMQGLQALAMELRTQPIEQIPTDKAVEEISQVIPYTIVLGGRERWLNALVATDTDTDPDPNDLGWYNAPGDWHMAELPKSLNSFILTIQGRLYGRD